MSFCEKKLCSGCGVCSNICPRHCINMCEDEYGVVYPKASLEQCVQCGLCEKACPVMYSPVKWKPQNCYAAYQSNLEVRENSASGGVAAALYEIFITNFQGKIYGVTAEKNGVYFMAADGIEAIEHFKGSQYTQADTGVVYQQVGEDLKNGYMVLFIGCPCQVAGCVNYVNILLHSLERLYTVDLLCHGVSPQRYLKEELLYLSKKKKWSDYSKVTFRTNRKNKNYHFTIKYKKKGYNVEREYSPSALASGYFHAFSMNIGLRESCFHCSYSTLERCGDITIGDFIGLGNQTASTRYDGKIKNTSVILTNTNKGEKLVSMLSPNVIKHHRPVQEAYQGGISMQGPGNPSILRDRFLKLYLKYGFAKSIRITLKRELIIASIKDFIKRVIQYE